MNIPGKSKQSQRSSAVANSINEKPTSSQTSTRFVAKSSTEKLSELMASAKFRKAMPSFNSTQMVLQLSDQRIEVMAAQVYPDNLDSQLAFIAHAAGAKEEQDEKKRMKEEMVKVLDPYADRELEFRVRPDGNGLAWIEKATIEKTAGKKIDKLEYFVNQWKELTAKDGKFELNVSFEYRLVC